MQILNRELNKYSQTVMRCLLKVIVMLALSSTLNAKEIEMAYELEIFNPKLSYKVMDVVHVNSENIYLLAGTYSVAKSMKGQKHIDGLWIKKINYQGKELLSEEYAFANEPDRAVVAISVTGEVIFLLEGAGERSFIHYKNKFLSLIVLDDIALSYVSSIGIRNKNQYWVVGQMFGSPKAILLSESGSVLQEYVGDKTGFFVDIQSLDNRATLLAYEGNKQSYYKIPGELVVFEVLVEKQGNLEFFQRKIGSGKFAIVGSISSEITLGVDSGVGMSQKIILRSLDDNDNVIWEKEVYNVKLGLEKFDFDVTDSYWVIAGTEKNRTYTIFVSKNDREKVYYYRDNRKLVTINNQVACGNMQCLVVGTRINATKNQTIKNKIALRIFNEQLF